MFLAEKINHVQDDLSVLGGGKIELMQSAGHTVKVTKLCLMKVTVNPVIVSQCQSNKQ